MTRTEAILSALHQAFLAAGGDAIPIATRNRTLADMLDELDGGAGGHLNLVDGDGVVGEVQLSGSGLTYEITHTATAEWLVQAVNDDVREAAFDAGLEAIAAVVESIDDAVRSGDAPYAGLLDAIDILGIARSNLAVDGAPALKGAEIQIRIQFVSSRPF